MPSSSHSPLRRTLVTSQREAVLTALHGVFAGGLLLNRLMVLHGATAMQYSVLAALTPLAQFFQLAASVLTRRVRSRRTAVVRLNLAGRGLVLLYGLLPFVLPPTPALWMLLALVFFSTALQAVGQNVWLAWMADMVPARMRGRFFARRAQLTMIAGLLAGYLVSGAVDLFSETSRAAAWLRLHANLDSILQPANLRYLFPLLFALGAFAAVWATRIQARQPEPAPTLDPTTHDHRLRTAFADPNLRRCLRFGLWWSLATGIGAPFWLPFMLKGLEMTLLNVQVYGTISTVAALVSLRPWGLLIDRFGNRPAMFVAILMGGLNPLLWLPATSAHHLIVYFEAATSGIMWSGAGVATTNLVLAIAPAAQRQLYSGLFSAASGCGSVVTMLLSGALMPPGLTLGPWQLAPEQTLFGLTGLARWSALLPLLAIHEPRARPVGDALAWMHRSAWETLRGLVWRAPEKAQTIVPEEHDPDGK